MVPVLIEGLKRLEYRGYDSAGIAVVAADQVRRVRRTGAWRKWKAPRWPRISGAARHRPHPLGDAWRRDRGQRAHPHISHGELALVHNGIIENHEQQRERLRALGYEFESQTDTEVIAHLIHHYRAQGDSLLVALQRAR